jgi:hypothetical protein
MATSWNKSMVSGDTITATNWNELVGEVQNPWVSSNFISHRDDTTIHFTADTLIDDFYPSTAGMNVSSQVKDLYSYSSASVGYYYPSGLGKGVSSQVHNIGDLSSNAIGLYFPSTLGKILVDFSSNSKFIYKASSATGGGGVSDLSDLTIDVDKDWDTKGIYNLGYISSDSIKGTTIIGHLPSSNLKTWFDTLYESFENIRFTSGWALVSSTSIIPHSLDSVPTAIGIMPSGTDAYGWSVTVDDTNITVYITASGLHCVNWYAGGISLVGIRSVLEDETPQLGGDLDAQSTYGVLDATYISAQVFSGGVYYTTLEDPVGENQLTSKKYVIDYVAAAGGGYTDEMAGDAIGILVGSGAGLLYSDALEQLSVIEYDTLSSNAKQGYTSGQKVVDSFDHYSYVESSSAIERYYPSTLGFNISTQVVDLFAASSTLNSLSAVYTGFSSNTGLYYPSALGKQVSSQVGIIGDLSSSSIGRYYPSTLGKGVSGMVLSNTLHSSNNSIHGLSTTNLVIASVSSQGKISGQWCTPLYRGLPTASESNCGQIIRTSGAAGDKTYVWVGVKNDDDAYEFVQLGIST